MIEGLTDLLAGDLSPAQRVWGALAPGLLVAAYFVIGLLLYAIRTLLRGQHRDPELEARGSSAVLGMWLRLYFAWLMQPLWRAIVRTGIPATAVTTLSLLMAMAAGVAIAAGRFSLGGWLYIFAGILDFLDGRLARHHGEASSRGAALDSILDRYSDSAILVGLAWFYRDSWVLLPTLVALVGTQLVPYVRAKGESLGVAVTVGVMQRAERIMYLGVMVALSPLLEVALRPSDPRPIHALAVAGIVLLAVSTQATAVQRIVFLLRALEAPQGAGNRESISKSLPRSVISAAVATLADFAVVVALVSELSVRPSLATALGCGVGAIINFTLNRYWTFRSDGPKVIEASRYTFVSFTSALLNSGGVAVLLLLPLFDYRLAWVLVRGAVFLTWNYPLQNGYVFGSPRSQGPAHELHSA